MNQHYLQLYADFIVKVGVNVRPRQNFIVRCPVTMPDFAHACVRAGYEAGAKTVVVRWEDDKLTRLNMELADERDLTAMKPYELRSYLDYAEDPDGCCTLAIHAENPEALAGLDAGKLNRVNLARRTFMKPWQEYTMNDRVQWFEKAHELKADDFNTLDMLKQLCFRLRDEPGIQEKYDKYFPLWKAAKGE